MRVVSILPPLAGMKLSMNVGPPVRLILDKLTFTNSKLMLRESFLPVTEDGSSSTVPSRKNTDKRDNHSDLICVFFRTLTAGGMRMLDILIVIPSHTRT